MRFLLIANPIAGGGAGRTAADSLAAELERRGHAARLAYTQQAGDGAAFAGEAGPDTDAIVVVGGDGTLNEALNGLPTPDAVPLIPYSQGTANMLARELGYPDDAAGMANVLEEGRERRVDLGTVRGADGGTGRFLLIVSSGFDAMVTEEVKRRRAGSLGFRGYFVPIWNVLRRYREPHLRVVLDGAETLDGAMVVVGNTRNYGGIFSVTDRAALDSGHFDVCVFERGSLAALLYFSAAALCRRLSLQPGIQYRTAHRIRIESDRPVAVEVDGDYYRETPVEIEVHPAGVRLLVP